MGGTREKSENGQPNRESRKTKIYFEETLAKPIK